MGSFSSLIILKTDLKSFFSKSNFWASLGTVIVNLSCEWVAFSCFFACFINFCWNLDTLNTLNVITLGNQIVPLFMFLFVNLLCFTFVHLFSVFFLHSVYFHKVYILTMCSLWNLYLACSQLVSWQRFPWIPKAKKREREKRKQKGKGKKNPCFCRFSQCWGLARPLTTLPLLSFSACAEPTDHPEVSVWSILRYILSIHLALVMCILF